MYLDVREISALVEVSHEYKLVASLKEIYKVSTNVSFIFSDWDVQALIPNKIFHEKNL